MEKFPQESFSQELPPENNIEKTKAESAEKNPAEVEIIALTDTHNDKKAIIRNLKFHEIVDKNGEWQEGVANLVIVHEGDIINKQNPNSECIEYLMHLKQTAPDGCFVEIQIGNHELEYLVEHAGMQEGKKDCEMIARMSIASHFGPVLFVHGYPTIQLLEEITKRGGIQEGVDSLNKQFQDAASNSLSGNKDGLGYFSFEKINNTTGEKNIFRNIKPEKYYKKHGAEIVALLKQLGIQIVVHGHSGQKKGVQIADEFKEFLPDITMINNDVSVSRYKNEKKKTRLGSTKITVVNDEEHTEAVTDIKLVNRKSS
ncbi:MAG: metallophosphoesterase [Candidatus Paceibacterota bacterium]